MPVATAGVDRSDRNACRAEPRVPCDAHRGSAPLGCDRRRNSLAPLGSRVDSLRRLSLPLPRACFRVAAATRRLHDLPPQAGECHELRTTKTRLARPPRRPGRGRQPAEPVSARAAAPGARGPGDDQLQPAWRAAGIHRRPGPQGPGLFRPFRPSGHRLPLRRADRRNSPDSGHRSPVDRHADRRRQPGPGAVALQRVSTSQGFRIVAAFDVDARIVGTQVEGIPVYEPAAAGRDRRGNSGFSSA